MKTKKLTSCTTAFEANVLKGALENEGIDCIIHNETSSQVMGAYGQVTADLFVAEEDYERAREIVEAAQPKDNSRPIGKAEILIAAIVLIIIGILSYICAT